MKFEYSFIAVTASDGDCYLSNFCPRQCGLFIVILSSTLSLKTVHRTVFLTVAFKSRHRLLVQIKRGLIFHINPLLMVRVTGLEPVRRETHAPQTCLSAYSSTLAKYFNIIHLGNKKVKCFGEIILF